YEALERALQARWLWPGELGEFVPKRTAVAMPEMNVTVSPRFLQRNLRSILHARGPAEFSPEALKKVRHDQDVWLRRHRMGKSVRLRYGHAFTNWWERFGKDHPEWFNLLENGQRKPPGGHVSMCVSNPEFHRLIVNQWKGRRAENPGEFVNINGCENDINGLCTCVNCRAWDGPDVKAISARYAQRCVSDRYARFWLTLQQLGSVEDPNATVVGYAYVNYAPPPTTDIRLNERIFVGTVPDLFFPRSAEEQEWVIAQWLGWRTTGCKLFLRPNYMLEGYCMPHLFTRQFAQEFLFEARNGMVGTDFDSLTAMWATHGPNLYLLGRMHVRPDLDADALLAEYYAGFGSAAQHVRAYFEYWEKYMLDNRERHEEVAKKRRAGWSSYAAKAHDVFPPESFKPAWERLEAAQTAAAADPTCLARVEFLRKGLTHAQLCAKTAAVIAGEEGKRPSPAACNRALAELRAFRKTIEMDNVANLNFCAFVEQRAWKVPEGYAGEPLRPLVETPADFAPPAMPTRGLHTCVVLLKAGERLRARLACQRIGQYTANCDWSVFSPSDERLANGSVAVGKDAMVDVAAPSAGVYSLVLNSGANVAAVTLLNPHAALTGRRIHLLGE
ncbi:MAG: DUF4838 domain-containing protein, partial [Planctomycetes bacterium]|nr:DUF4838 domain-containing protein [Planctomycetota bacterium]